MRKISSLLVLILLCSPVIAATTVLQGVTMSGVSIGTAGGSCSTNYAVDLVKADGDFLSKADPSGLDITGHSFLYVAGWFNSDTFGSTETLMGKANGTTDRSWFILNQASNSIRFYMSSDGTNAAAAIDSATGLSTATWYFFEAYYDPTNDVAGFSINREADRTTTGVTGGLFNSSQDFKMGDGSGNQKWDGYVDNVIVLTTALPSSGERDAIYNSGIPVNCADLPSFGSATKVACYDLNEASGTRDDSVGSNDLTENGTGGVGRVTGIANC